MTKHWIEENKPLPLSDDYLKRIQDLFEQGKLSFETSYISTDGTIFEFFDLSLVPIRQIFTGTAKLEDE